MILLLINVFVLDTCRVYNRKWSYLDITWLIFLGGPTHVRSLYMDHSCDIHSKFDYGDDTILTILIGLLEALPICVKIQRI